MHCSYTSKRTSREPSESFRDSLPDFVIIGAMKSGTTTLDAYLRRHPQIFMSTPKEPGFFSRDERYAEGIESYRRFFHAARPEQLCGEASTCYTRHLEYPLAAQRIGEHLPDAKLIYLLRHPVDRAYSHYAHIVAEGWSSGQAAPLGVLDALDSYPTIVDSSCYAAQISAYARYFQAGRLLVLTLDDLRRDPNRVLRDVQRFLGLPERDLVRGRPLTKNRAGQSIANRRAWQRLAACRQSRAAALIRHTLPSTAREWIRRRMLKRFAHDGSARVELEHFKSLLDPPTPETRRILLTRVVPDTERLEDMLGRRFPDWKK